MHSGYISEPPALTARVHADGQQTVAHAMNPIVSGYRDMCSGRRGVTP